MSEAFANLNAWTSPLADNPTFDGFAGTGGSLYSALMPSVDSCLLDLIRGLAQASVHGTDDSKTEQFVMDALVTPFNEAASALKAIFVPPDSGKPDFSTEYVKSMGAAMGASFANPFMAMIQMQTATFNTSTDKLAEMFTLTPGAGKSSVTSEIIDRGRIALRTLLFGSVQAEQNLAGLVLYALEEGIPALDAEAVYLRKMRKLVKTLNEQCSSLPPSFTPSIPNFAVTTKLCEAEERLRRVAAELKNSRKFNRTEFGQATTAVCESKDMIFDGSVSSSVQKQIKNFFALDDKQWSALKSGKFLPDAKLRVTMIELQMLDACMLRVDAQVMSLHRNLQGLMLTLQSLSTVHAADILALIIEIVKRQIGALRADLEAQSAGFAGALKVVPGGPIQEVQTKGPMVTKYGASRRFTNPGSNATGTDIYSYMTSQATAYAMLTTLCFVMERAQVLYKNIDAIVNGNSRFVKMIMDIVGMYKGISCGNDLGGTLVDESLKAYFDTIEGRLNGTVTSNARIGEAAKRVTTHIDEQLVFLDCIRKGLFMGRGRLADQASQVLNAVKAARNLASLIQRRPSLKEIARTLDLSKLSAENAIQYDAADVIMRALQCMILQCDNAYLKNVMKQAQNQFGRSFNNAKAQAITMASLGEVPRVAQQVALNQRVQAFFQLINSLRKLTSMNPRELCAIDTKPKTKVKADPAPTAAAVSDERKKAAQMRLGSNNKSAQAAAEATARQAAVDAATPLA